MVNDGGALRDVKFTLGNYDDRKHVPQMKAGLWGKLIGARGYSSPPLFTLLYERGLQLITKIRKNIKHRLLPLADKLRLRKRTIIAMIDDQLKNIWQLEHTRHRSIVNFCGNLVAALVAYALGEKKPSLRIDPELLKALPPAALA